MFGHHDDNQDDQKDHEPEAVQHDQAPAETHNEVVHPGEEDHPAPAENAGEEPAVVAAESAADQPTAGPEDTDTFDAGANDAPASDAAEDQPWQHPGTPINDDQPADEPATDTTPTDDTPAPIEDVIYPAGFPKQPTMQPGGAPTPAPLADESQPDEAPKAAPAPTHELLDIKVKALDELAPLIDDLDMSAEDKFRIVMMMIQASDNQDLVAKAYETAHAIEDEKVRAQALLDVVNEINYFTQPQQSEEA